VDRFGRLQPSARGKHFAVWRNGNLTGVTATTHQRLARLIYLLTAEPHAVCDAAARLGWVGRTIRLQSDGEVLVVTPWLQR
jgi:hypothetical protein